MTTGYRSKPIWIYVIAGLLLITPFVHMMGMLHQAGEPEWYLPRVWLIWLRRMDLAPAIISFMLFIAGLGILAVRPWSWWLGLGVLFAVCIYDIYLIRRSFAADTFTQSIATIGSALLFGLLYFSGFKGPFLKSRLRWWESERRYHVSLPASVQIAGSAEKIPVQIRDISRSGVYLEARAGDAKLKLPHDIVVGVNAELQLPCRFSRPTENGGSAFQITKISRFQSRFLRRWIRLLAKDPRRLVR